MSGSTLNFWSRYVPGEQMLHMFMIGEIKSECEIWSWKCSNDNYTDCIYKARGAGKYLQNDKDLRKFIETVNADFFVNEVDTTVSIVGNARKELELIWAPVIEGILEWILYMKFIFRSC